MHRGMAALMVSFMATQIFSTPRQRMALVGNALVTYGTRTYGLLVNINGRRISTLRPADGLDYHSAVTRFLGLPSDVFGSRLPDTGFTQYGGLIRLSYNLNDDSQFLLSYARNQQNNGKR